MFLRTVTENYSNGFPYCANVIFLLIPYKDPEDIPYIHQVISSKFGVTKRKTHTYYLHLNKHCQKKVKIRLIGLMALYKKYKKYDAVGKKLWTY